MRISSQGIREVTYFAPIWYRQLLALILSVLTLGLFYVFAYIFRRQLWIKLTCRKSIIRGDARYVIAKDDQDNTYVASLEIISHDGLLLAPQGGFFSQGFDLAIRRTTTSAQPRASAAPNLFESKFLTPCLRIGGENFGWDQENGSFGPMSFKSPSIAEANTTCADHAILNPEKDDQMTCFGFEKLPTREKIVIAGYIFTFGLLWLVFYWKPSWRLKFTHRPCNLLKADCILLTDLYKRSFVRPVRYISRDGISVKPVDRAKADCYFIFRPAAQASILRYITVQKLRYFWSPERQCFEKYQGLMGESPTFMSLHQFKGLTQDESADRRVLAGPNSINVRITPVLSIIFREILSPFYIFQIFSCTLWYTDQYYIFASCIVFLSSISVMWTVYLTRHNERALRRTVHAAQPVTVCRPDGSEEDIMPDQLTPGDVVIIPRHGTVMQCDAVLQCGNCIVNESMLTGESVPVTKMSLPIYRNPADDQLLHVKVHEKHVLFCGTRVIQTKYFSNKSVRAVVLSTGFMTAKGDLIRSILFPKPLDFKFMVDAMKFVGLLAIIAGIGLIYSLVLRLDRQEAAQTIIVRCLDLVTIVVPPALPIALSVGYATAQRRLKREKIFCVSPSTINVCGVVDIVCFDKTGTLTEDGLDFSRVVPCQRGQFQAPVTSGSYIPARSSLATCMATCHSLAIIEGDITGDPIDLKMFQETGWELEEPAPAGGDAAPGEGNQAGYEVLTPTIVRPRNLAHSVSSNSSTPSPDANVPAPLPFEVGIMRQFPFSSSLQRMSVITRVLGEKYFALYLKGAPEVVVSLCQPHTVPRDFTAELIQYTQQGYRVLGLAWKYLPGMSYAKTQRVERQHVENNLEFIGLLILENRLKPQTAPVIAKLRDANLRCLMVTGDNTLTALSVGRDCGLIDDNDQVILVNAQPPAAGDPDAKPTIEFVLTPDISSRRVNRIKQLSCNSDSDEAGIMMANDSPNVHFAMTGKTWSVVREYFPDYVPRMVVRGTIFARFTPTQKQQLVEALQELGYYVAMCGDGANDCGALKTAHAGISLSEAEASVASPFTSQNANIECVPTVIREGRAALVTSSGVFRFMVSYSLIQFTSTCLLYYIGANLSDFEFLYVDLIVLTTLGFTFTLTESYPSLVPQRPPSSLLALKPVVSLFAYLAINLSFQVLAFVFVQSQPWYLVLKKADVNDRDFYCFENYSVFSVSIFQYVSMAIVLSKGPPFRKLMFTNWMFVLNLVLVIVLNSLVVLYPPRFIEDALQIMLPPSMEFRACILGIALLNFLVCLTIESAIIEAAWPGRLCHWVCHCFAQKHGQQRKDQRSRTISTTSWNNPHSSQTISDGVNTAIRFRHPVTGRNGTTPSANSTTPNGTTMAKANGNGVRGSNRSPATHHQIISQQLARHPEWPPVSAVGDLRFLQDVFIAPLPSVATMERDLHDLEGDEDDDEAPILVPDDSSASALQQLASTENNNNNRQEPSSSAAYINENNNNSNNNNSNQLL